MADTPLVLGKIVERVITLERQRDGSVSRKIVYDDRVADLREPRKRQTGVLKPLEKRTRKGMRRGIEVIQAYLSLHERSNRRKKNGWAKDLMRNVGKAVSDDRP